jgi:hypothetical protein
MTTLIRQGDVVLRRVESLPDGVQPVPAENGRLVLAHGEATGHHHSFALANNVALFREDGSGGGLFLTVTGTPASLEHQEHTTLLLQPGYYEVRRQREYHPKAIRRVED